MTSGALPAGLTLNGTTGVISGTPTTAGSDPFTITVTNGAAPAASTAYTFAVYPTLAATGVDAGPGLALGFALLAAGFVFLAARALLARRVGR